MRSATGVGAVILALALSGAGSLPLAAEATTGENPLEDLPIYDVTPAQARPFVGGFTLVSPRPHRGGLISASLSTRYIVNVRHFGPTGVSVLEGEMQLRAYEATGRASISTATLYEYRYRRGVMRIDLWSPSGSTLLGRLRLRAQDKGRVLAGTLELLAPARSKRKHGGKVRHTYSVVFEEEKP